jgi:lipoyl synthase
MLNSKHPPWLTRRVNEQANSDVLQIIKGSGVHTVCQEACCPNIWECFKSHRATFMILGEHCTRDCRFCAVKKGPLAPLDISEAERVTTAAEKMGLKHVVITSVTRDDLSDGGAIVFAHVIKSVKQRIPGSTVEVLTPDFQGKRNSLETVLLAGPDIFNHNVETVPRLYKDVRPEADYRLSLNLLKNAKEFAPKILVKSGIMVGLGETWDEIWSVAQDLKTSNCDIVTVGQYLRPTKAHVPVAHYYTPDEFSELKKKIQSLGFKHVAAAPLVRSSYRADEVLS